MLDYGDKVRLTVDLTRYHREFKAGVVGTAERPRPGQFDRFFLMRLPSGAAIDVLWQSVEPEAAQG